MSSSSTSAKGSSNNLATNYGELPQNEEKLPRAHCNATQVMNQRYLQSLSAQADAGFLMSDIADVATLLADGKINQIAPDCAHLSYLASVEKADSILCPDYTKMGKASALDRETIILLIQFLWKKKQYKHVTFNTAVHILDQYLYQLSLCDAPVPGQTILATASLLLAAKIEQSIVPSFVITIGQLPSQLQKHISKKDLINVEFDIVQRLQFSVRAVCPVFIIER